MQIHGGERDLLGFELYAKKIFPRTCGRLLRLRQLLFVGVELLLRRRRLAVKVRRELLVLLLQRRVAPLDLGGDARHQPRVLRDQARLKQRAATTHQQRVATERSQAGGQAFANQVHQMGSYNVWHSTTSLRNDVVPSADASNSHVH